MYDVDPSLRGSEPVIWNQVVHIGGLFAERERILAVGGYHDGFRVWGNEDTDLQWKLAVTGGVGILPDSERLEVLHLDHDKEYFLKDVWLRNKEIHARRRKRGVERAIRNDRLHLRALEVLSAKRGSPLPK